ncbi:hypothetical protein EHP00_2352 [Ecytonucleospora hepatopenaei]|uniref:Uncharacterized protein n=1 Tax=Ecytonucleospora hepatopenaei TaxID=646526 RepID=A0A1W0E9F0_9MICR|nr:hypothetical protein EHP00_2352 [Ecytonucleospora hepatopenaei]
MSKYKEIESHIKVLRKAYDQPLLFYVIHCRLRNLLCQYPLKTFTNDMIRLICFSAMPNTLPNQGLELKITKVMNLIKPSNIFSHGHENHDRNEDKFKLMIIIFYLLNRPEKNINHMVLFNLVTNFLGHDDVIDSLIIAVVRKISVASVFDGEVNSKLTKDAYLHVLQTLKNTKLSLGNKIACIPCFIGLKYPIEIDFFIDVTAKSSFLVFNILNTLCFL